MLDNVYEKFASRDDLQKNCEIRISFIEIYKESVTDLLEGHKQIKIQSFLKKLDMSNPELNKSAVDPTPASDSMRRIKPN